MKPFAVGAGAPSPGGTALGATLTPLAGSTGYGPDGAFAADAAGPPALPAPPARAAPWPCAPPRPPPPPPALSAVDHISTVLYFGPSITCSSLPLYIGFIVARPFASRTRSV